MEGQYVPACLRRGLPTFGMSRKVSLDRRQILIGQKGAANDGKSRTNAPALPTRTAIPMISGYTTKEASLWTYSVFRWPKALR